VGNVIFLTCKSEAILGLQFSGRKLGDLIGGQKSNFNQKA